MEPLRDGKPFSPEEFKELYSRVVRLTVDLVIQTPKGIVLTLRAHSSWKGQWHFPGGTVLYRESVLQTIDRVARVEIGKPVTVEKMLGYIEYPSEEKERGFGSTVSLCFLCTSEDTEFTVNEDASEVGMFTTLPEGLIAEQADFLKKHWSEIEGARAGTLH